MSTLSEVDAQLLTVRQNETREDAPRLQLALSVWVCRQTFGPKLGGWWWVASRIARRVRVVLMLATQMGELIAHGSRHSRVGGEDPPSVTGPSTSPAARQRQPKSSDATESAGCGPSRGGCANWRQAPMAGQVIDAMATTVPAIVLNSTKPKGRTLAPSRRPQKTRGEAR